MGLFNFKKAGAPQAAPVVYNQMMPTMTAAAPAASSGNSNLAQLAFSAIQDGIIIVDGKRVIKTINPAATKMTGNLDDSFALGIDLALIFKLETDEGRPIADAQNPVFHAIETNQEFKSRDFVLAAKDSDKKYPLEIKVVPTKSPEGDRIVTFRDIQKELEESKEQSEFISTASHEMRTPVASIEGYLGLTLNPQTATIDERARKYLESAREASRHLGKLFQDLLDVTKLDDRKIKPHSVPVDLAEVIKKISDGYIDKFKQKEINYGFGTSKAKHGLHSVEQKIYSFADVDFLHEIMSNLIENAIKYSPQGGSIWVSVNGEDERAIISVADTGIGIPQADLEHIFQKFYRVDNSATREIGGTGLGLYLVKQRTTSMGGAVWVESMLGKGSTFFVALPRISQDEYEKRKIAMANYMQAVQAKRAQETDEAMAALRAAQVQQAQKILATAPKAVTAPVATTAAATQLAVAQPATTETTTPAPVAQPVAQATVPAQPAQTVQVTAQAKPTQTAQPTAATDSTTTNNMIK